MSAAGAWRRAAAGREGLVTVPTHAADEAALRDSVREVWGPAYGDETHYLRVHVAHIRRKLERDPARPEILLTDAGVGYRLAPEP